MDFPAKRRVFVQTNASGRAGVVVGITSRKISYSNFKWPVRYDIPFAKKQFSILETRRELASQKHNTTFIPSNTYCYGKQIIPRKSKFASSRIKEPYRQIETPVFRSKAGQSRKASMGSNCVQYAKVTYLYMPSLGVVFETETAGIQICTPRSFASCYAMSFLICRSTDWQSQWKIWNGKRWYPYRSIPFRRCSWNPNPDRLVQMDWKSNRLSRMRFLFIGDDHE